MKHLIFYLHFYSCSALISREYETVPLHAGHIPVSNGSSTVAWHGMHVACLHALATPAVSHTCSATLMPQGDICRIECKAECVVRVVNADSESCVCVLMSNPYPQGTTVHVPAGADVVGQRRAQATLHNQELRPILTATKGQWTDMQLTDLRPQEVCGCASCVASASCTWSSTWHLYSVHIAGCT